MSHNLMTAISSFLMQLTLCHADQQPTALWLLTANFSSFFFNKKNNNQENFMQ